MYNPSSNENQLIHINADWLDEIMTENTMERGEACYRENHVINCRCTKIGNGCILRAAVKSQSIKRIYTVHLKLDRNGNLITHSCTCPAHSNYEGLCKHCVAVILQYQAYVDQKTESASAIPEPPSFARKPRRPAPSPAPKTPVETYLAGLPESASDTREKRRLQLQYEATSPLINTYKSNLQKLTGDYGIPQPEGIVRLLPVLTAESSASRINLSFFVQHKSANEIAKDRESAEGQASAKGGSQADQEAAMAARPPVERSGASTRPYVIKSLSTFLHNVHCQENVSYGRDLSFVHTASAFDEASRLWLALLDKHLDNCSGSRKYLYASANDKYMYVSDEALSDIFECFTAQGSPDGVTFWTETANGRVDRTPAYFGKEPPQLVISLKQEDSGIITMKCATAQYCSIGGAVDHNYIYSFEDRVLRRLALSASKAIEPLATALARHKGTLEFLPQQRNDLFTHVLPEIAPHVRIKDPQKLMRTYGAEPMEGKFLLDAPDRSTVTITIIASYRGLWLNLETGQMIGRMEETVTDLSSAVRIDWDAAAIDPSELRRDIHAERRFLAASCQALRLPRDEAVERLAAGSAATAWVPIRVSGSDDLFELITNGVQRLQALGEALVTDRMRKLTAAPPPRVSVGVAIHSGLLEIAIDAGDVALDELRQLLQAYHEKRRYYRLKSGGYVDLHQNESNADTETAFASLEALNQMRLGLQLDEEDMQTGALRMPAFRALYLDGLFNESIGLTCSRDESFLRLTQRIRDFAHAEFAEPESLRSVLRPYQKEGYRWLRCLEACSFGGILADDMGLGKSVQLIAVLLAYYESAPSPQEALPSLIACPSSLVWNWKKELEKFAPSLRIRIIQGTAAARTARLEDTQPEEIVITSYDSLKRDLAAYESLRFQYFAIDEAQYIKNHATQAAKAVKKIVCRQRFALTGTPIENRLSELWSIFDFLMPGYLYRYARFREQFENPIVKDGDASAKAALRGMILPFVLRRLKRDVLAELPPKTTTVVPVELDAKQMEAYNATLLTGLSALRAEAPAPDKAGAEKIKVLALLTRLRRLCCDPRLCYDNYKEQSAKLEACMELLQQAKDGEHRVLLFSQYTDMLDLLESRLIRAGMSYLRLQGSTPAKDRMGLVDTFNLGKTDVFLISLKAGGTGLNLTAADTVIHYDPWWNLAAQDQATDRAYRIGQKRKVQVYKLIAQDTIEEKILKLQEMKSDLAAIIEGDGEDALMRMSTDEIITLLENR